MAQDSERSESDVKTQFSTREGVYQQVSTSDFFYPKRVPFVSPSSPSHTAVVKTSYVRVKQDEKDEQEDDCICFTVGKNLFYFTHSAFKQQSKQFQFVDKRQYKGAAPSCHDINQFTASPESVKVAVGFLAGQVQIIDVKKKESLQIMNEVRSIDKSSVTCVKWYPNSDNLVLSSHICGFMYTYDVTITCSEATPTYHSQPYKMNDGYSIYTVKSKSTSTSPNSYNSSNSYANPLYKWVMTTDGTAVCSFEFSPCSRFVAVITQNGYLRVIDHQTFESYGCMKSYFGGLMTCSWSPDGRFIVTGGEDDLITVWSFCQQCVVARGSSHKSWISDIAFDPYQCVIPSDADMKTYYHLSSVNDFVATRRAQNDFLKTSIDNDEKKSPSLIRYKKHEDKDNSRTLPKCNGDSKLPVPSDAIKRLRTYSNVSRISRISLCADSPPLCYRFGSIGQDSLLCLWEIDENIIDFMHRRPSAFKQPDPIPEDDRKSITEHSNESPNPAGSNSDVHASSISDYSSTGSNNYQYYLHNPGMSNSVGEPPAPTLAAGSRSSSVPAAINTAVSSKKEGKSSKSGTSNGFSMIRKFATIGSHDRSKKESKHKRNLSLPYFGIKSSSSQNGSSAKLNAQKDKLTLGTILCPTFEDTQMLDPLTCKKVSPSRLTSIAFKKDSILITCQEGYMQAWQRPNVGSEDLSAPSSPSSSNGQVRVNGTVV